MCWNASDGNGHSPTSLHEVIRTSKSVAKCCRTDTPLASSSNVSRSRPTTDPHGCFVTRAADDSPEVTSPRWPRRVSQHPPRAWARGYFDGLTGPVLRAGPDVETRPHSPSGGYAKGNRGRVRMSSPRPAARRTHNARPIRHSVGRKVAIHWNIAGASQSGH